MTAILPALTHLTRRRMLAGAAVSLTAMALPRRSFAESRGQSRRRLSDPARHDRRRPVARAGHEADADLGL